MAEEATADENPTEGIRREPMTLRFSDTLKSTRESSREECRGSAVRGRGRRDLEGDERPREERASERHKPVFQRQRIQWVPESLEPIDRPARARRQRQEGHREPRGSRGYRWGETFEGKWQTLGDIDTRQGRIIRMDVVQGFALDDVVRARQAKPGTE
jgi:hypothetical protein